MSASSLSSLTSSSTQNSGTLITKFEAKSSRVKGVAFHPTLPWLLAAHHNGSVQIYDYRMGIVVDKYEEHQGTTGGL
jgi:coatomer protein complex subunit alpha (xenin)